jgi:hypothetical protein
VRVRRWLALAAVVLLAAGAVAWRDGLVRAARPASTDALAAPGSGPPPAPPRPTTTGPAAPGPGVASPPGPPWAARPGPPGSGYFPLPPAVLVDRVRLGPGGTLVFPVTGPMDGGRPSSGVPAGGVGAVALNVVAAVPTGSGRLALFPAGPPPSEGAATVAFAAGRAGAGFTIVEVPSDGRLAVRNSGATGATTVTVRLRGYYAAPCGRAGAGYLPAAPAELVRRVLGPGQAAAFQPAGQASLPAAVAGAAGGVAAVALEVAAAAPAGGGGALEVAAAGVAPGAAGPAVAFQAGRDATGLEVVPVPAGNRLVVRNGAGTGTVTAVVRLRGWFAAPGAAVPGAAFHPVPPTRVLAAAVPTAGAAAFTTAVAGLPPGQAIAVALTVLAAAEPGSTERAEPGSTERAESGSTERAGASRRPGAAPGAEAGPPGVEVGFVVAAVGRGGRVAVPATSGTRVSAWLRGWFGAAAPLTAVPEPATTRIFDRAGDPRPGWTGGDGSYPVRLPDGRTAWLFGDSFIGAGTGPPGPRSGRPDQAGLVRNAVVVQDGTRLTTLLGPADPATGAPGALLRPAAAGGGQLGAWYWPAGGFVEDGRLRVLVQEFRPGSAAEPGGFEWTGRNRAVTLGLPGLAQLGDAPVYGRASGSEVQWGVAVLEEADYTYVYGVRDLGGPLHVKHTHLARFPHGGSHGFWRFWDGAGWSPSPAASAALAGAPGRGGPTPLTGIAGSVAKLGASYVLLSIPDFGTAIEARLSCGPVGPWGPPQRLYEIPELRRPGGDRAYLARAYPEGDGLLVAYSLGPGGPGGDFARAAYYRPRYLRIRAGQGAPAGTGGG